jgi:AcrR family transcriptional regulator
MTVVSDWSHHNKNRGSLQQKRVPLSKKFISRKDRAQDTKRRLYTAAEALFTKHDFDDVSVDRIVRQAGFSKGTFYVHFESKDDLLISLISDYVERVDLDYQAFVDTLSPDLPAADILMQLTDKIMAVMIDTVGAEKMKTLYRAQLTNISKSSAATNYQRLLYKTLTDVFERGKNRNEFSTDLSSEELANHLILAMRGLIYEWCIRYPEFDLKMQAREHFEILLKGIQ